MKKDIRKKDAPRGHEYGFGRATRAMKHKNARRERDKLRREIQAEAGR